MSAHTTNQIVSVATVLPADQSVAVAVAVVSDALKIPVASFTANQTAVADLTGRPASIVTAHTAGQIVSPWV